MMHNSSHFKSYDLRFQFYYFYYNHASSFYASNCHDNFLFRVVEMSTDKLSTQNK